jgi:hypothetical protein
MIEKREKLDDLWRITWYGDFSGRPAKIYPTKLKAIAEFNSFSQEVILDWDKTKTKANVIYYQTIVAVLEKVDTDKLMKDNFQQWFMALSKIRNYITTNKDSYHSQVKEILEIVRQALKDFTP